MSAATFKVISSWKLKIHFSLCYFLCSKASIKVACNSKRSIQQSLYIFSPTPMPLKHQRYCIRWLIPSSYSPFQFISHNSLCNCTVPTHQRRALMAAISDAHQPVIQHWTLILPRDHSCLSDALGLVSLEIGSDQGLIQGHAFYWGTAKPRGSKGSRRGKGRKMSGQVASRLGITHGGLCGIKCPRKLSSELR